MYPGATTAAGIGSLGRCKKQTQKIDATAAGCAHGATAIVVGNTLIPLGKDCRQISVLSAARAVLLFGQLFGTVLPFTFRESITLILPPRRRIFRQATRAQTGGVAMLLLIALAVLGGGVAMLPGLNGSRSGRASPPPAHISARGSALAVVDADTLRLHDTVVRLKGVLAPRRGQACRDAQGTMEDCGGAAATALSALIGDRPVECRLFGRDGTGRPLGRCAAGGVDLNRAVVAIGWARAASDTGEFVTAEQAARARHLGLWQRTD